MVMYVVKCKINIYDSSEVSRSIYIVNIIKDKWCMKIILETILSNGRGENIFGESETFSYSLRITYCAI